VLGSGIVQVDTDARGEFRATFPEGVYELIISSRGELSLMLRGVGILAGHTQHLTRALTPGEEAEEGLPSAAIGGYLVDRLNHPLVDAAITAIAHDGKQTYTAKSDTFGAFLIHAVQPARWRANASRLRPNEPSIGGISACSSPEAPRRTVSRSGR
jgi:hypothetical protein